MLLLMVASFFSYTYPACESPTIPRIKKIPRSGSVSSFMIENSPRDELEFRITEGATRIVKHRLLKTIKHEEGKGLDSVLQNVLDNAEMYRNELLMQGPKELLKSIILLNPSIYDARNKALEFTHSPPKSLEIRTAAWSVFKFLVIKKLNVALKKSAPSIASADNDLELHFTEQGIFTPDESQQHMLRKYIIAFTYLLSKHEIKDPDSFCEEYKNLLPGYVPCKEKK